MMRIAIDATSIPRLMAGAGVYTYNLIRALAEVDHENEYVVFTRSDAFDDLRRGTPPFEVVRVKAPSRPARLLWEQTVLSRELLRRRIDVLHSPHHTAPVLARGVRRVITFHDLTFFVLPGRYPPTRRLYFQTVSRLTARLADALICPSNAVRDDILRLLKVDPSRVRAIAEAAAPAFRPLDDAAAVERLRLKHLLPERFVLSVGSLEPGKNRTTLLRAYAKLREQGIEQKLVVVGQRAWRYEGDFRLAEELGLKRDVVFAGYVSPEDMPALYNAADLFVFPSLYEGFGLPVLEAMACGVPVVASNVSAVPEVAGEAALLVDPSDVRQICDAVERLLRDDTLRSALRERGLQRAAEFRWEKAARETVEVYGQAARAAK
jgi:glycosyltransferase involved in cell wall biosynthesis